MLAEKFKDGYEKFDGERWYEGGFNRLLKFFLEINPTFLVILSGDVHYGFTILSKVRRQKSGRSLSIAQLTSSALKNSNELTRTLGSLKSLRLGKSTMNIDSLDFKEQKNGLEIASKVAAMGQRKFVGLKRKIVGHNNIGKVVFTRSRPNVRHQLAILEDGNKQVQTASVVLKMD